MLETNAMSVTCYILLRYADVFDVIVQFMQWYSQSE